MCVQAWSESERIQCETEEMGENESQNKKARENVCMKREGSARYEWCEREGMGECACYSVRARVCVLE